LVRRIILGCLVVEVATFAAAVLLHSGISIFGRVEEQGIPEAFVQGSIAVAVAICTLGFWARKAWARSTLLVCQLMGIGGALFGMFAALLQSGRVELDTYDAGRLVLLLFTAVLLLALPKEG
jgi:hypothetical protein